jgi:2-iminobutanoate/2-iminopropanoate deaminase
MGAEANPLLVLGCLHVRCVPPEDVDIDDRAGRVKVPWNGGRHKAEVNVGRKVRHEMQYTGVVERGKILIATDEAPRPRGDAPYVQAVVFGDLVFASGQLPIDPATGQLVPGGIVEQTTRTLANLDSVLRAAGSDISKLLKTTVYLTTHANWAAMNEVYRDFVGDVPPARSAVSVTSLSLSALVEIDGIAYR